MLARASRIASLFWGHFCSRWHAAPMPDRPAPMIRTSKCSVKCSGDLTAYSNGGRAEQPHARRRRKRPGRSPTVEARFRARACRLVRGLSFPFGDRGNKTLPPVGPRQFGGGGLNLDARLAIEVDAFDQSI